MAPCRSVYPYEIFFHPESSPQLSDVDLLADKITAYLAEKPITERCRPQPTEILLTEAERTQIQRDWILVHPLIKGTCSIPPFVYLAKGTMHKIYTHEQFPHLVFKKMRLSQAAHQAGVSQEAIRLVQHKNLSFIHIPPGTVIALEENVADPLALYVEEKLPITFTEKEYQELHRILLDRLTTGQSDTFCINFTHMISQAAELILALGYDDVSSENGPLFHTVDGKELCFTDFDRALKNEQTNQWNGGWGLCYLFEMFPHPKMYEALLPLINQLDPTQQKEIVRSIEATLKESNLDLLGRSNYMPAAFLS